MVYDDLQWMWTYIGDDHKLHPTVDPDPVLSAIRGKPHAFTAQVQTATQRHMRHNLDLEHIRQWHNNLSPYQDNDLPPRLMTDDNHNDKTMRIIDVGPTLRISAHSKH
eukprot:1856869-Pyramimonas_sp.AAC.1